MHMIQTLARPEVPQLPAYNAGLSSEAVRARYGVSEIARLASNENPYGASPAVARSNLVARAAPTQVYRALDFLIEHGFIHKLESINEIGRAHV